MPLQRRPHLEPKLKGKNIVFSLQLILIKVEGERVKHAKAASDHFHLALHTVHHTCLKVCELKISHLASIIYRIFMYYTFLIQHSLKDENLIIYFMHSINHAR